MTCRWYEFTRGDVIFVVVALLIVYSVTGPPEGISGWAGSAVGLLIGKFVVRAAQISREAWHDR